MARRELIYYGDLKDPLLKQRDALPPPIDRKQLLLEEADAIADAGENPLSVYDREQTNNKYAAKTRKQEEQQMNSRRKSNPLSAQRNDDGNSMSHGDPEMKPIYDALDAKRHGSKKKPGSSKNRGWDDTRKSAIDTAKMPEEDERFNDNRTEGRQGRDADNNRRRRR